MKIALCFSGQPRSLDQSYPSIKENLINGYDVDVFVHSWIDENNSYEFIADGIQKAWSGINQDPKSKEKIIQMYNPKRTLFEFPKIFYSEKMNKINSFEYFKPLFEKRCNCFMNEKGFKHFINMIHSMWYSIMMSNLQKEIYRLETGIEYDYVVRARFDIIYTNKLKYEQLNPDILYASNKVSNDHIHDFFAISNNKNMNIYSNLFLNLEYYLNLVTPDWRCGEGILFKMMEHFNIPCQEINFTQIIRPKY